MSSILTNTSAMVALQTMKSINTSLTRVQSEISTGKSVATARDNAAVWSISKVMESDVKGFKGISDSLSLGSSTLTVAREASEKIQGLLTDMKEKIVTAQGENVPREKLQTDINALRDQIAGIVGAAQFSGLNLISGTEDVKFLSSLDRSDAGVTTSDITVARQDMSTKAGVMGSGADGVSLNSNVQFAGATPVPGGTPTSVSKAGNTATVTIAGTFAAGNTADVTINGAQVSYAWQTGDTVDDIAAALSGAINGLGIQGVSAAAGAGGVITITSANAFEDVNVAAAASGGTAQVTALSADPSHVAGASGTIAERAEKIEFSNAANVNEGDGYSLSIDGKAYSYVAGKGETMEDVARGLKIAIDSGKVEGINTRVAFNGTSSKWELKVDFSGVRDDAAVTSRAVTVSGYSGGTASGGMFGLDSLDVTTKESARAALENIESMISRAIDAAAEFGSAQGRIDIQAGFVTSLTDALTAGIGTLVDADMEEASARLQALQVQQQLGIQALSIANQQPQNLLALFR